jgi:hypothetical protein
MDKSLSGKQAIAKVSAQTEILSAMISNTEANALTYKISKNLGVDDSNKDNAIALSNYPNPFTAQTVIQYHLPENADKATLKVFDTAGRTVYMQSDLDASQGNHEFTFQRRDLASGIYFYTIEIQNGAKPAIFKGKMLIQ